MSALVLPLLGACSTTGSYADPEYRPTAGYRDLPPLQQSIPVALEVAFLRNGQRASGNDAALRRAVIRVFERSNVVHVVAGAPVQGVFQISADNRFDVRKAMGAGIGTGATYGARESTVTDRYEFQLTYTPLDGSERMGRYQHAIHTILARTPRPRGTRLVAVEDAFGHVVEDVLLTFLNDLFAVEDAPTPIIFLPGNN